MNFEAPSGTYSKQEKAPLQQHEALEGLRFVLHDLVEEILKEKGIGPEVGEALRRFEHTLDNSILYAPISVGGLALVDVLDGVGKLSAWHELAKLGMEAARIKPGNVVLPTQDQADSSSKRSA